MTAHEPRKLIINVAGIPVELVASGAQGDELLSIWSAFPPADESACRLELGETGITCTGPGSPPNFIHRYHGISQFGLLSMAIGMVIEQKQPDFLLFHANVLRSTRSERLLLLHGPSGVGKSSLSRALAADGEFDVFVEDLAIVDSSNGLLHCFPRAASERIAGGVKKREARTAATLPLTAPLHQATIVSLRPSTTETISAARPNTGFRVSAPWAALHDELESCGLPITTPESADSRVVNFADPPSGAQRQLLAKILLRHGILILSPVVGKSTGIPTQRPPRPVIARQPPGPALHALLEDSLRFGYSSTTEPRRFFEAARAFARCNFIEVIPGGSEADTAQDILVSLAP